VILKVGDWTSTTDKSGAPDKLTTLLKKYKIHRSKDMPVLYDVRGKIFLMNRISENHELGVPIIWKNDDENILVF